MRAPVGADLPAALRPSAEAVAMALPALVAMMLNPPGARRGSRIGLATPKLLLTA
jgi:hypothetical protein